MDWNVLKEYQKEEKAKRMKQIERRRARIKRNQERTACAAKGMLTKKSRQYKVVSSQVIKRIKP